MKVLLIVAMSSELKGFLDVLDYEVVLFNGIKVYKSKCNNVELYIAKSEVGKVNAATTPKIINTSINSTKLKAF